jgi:hypothetical protein
MAQKNNTGSSLSFSKILEITRHKTIALIALAALLILGFWITHEIRKTANDLELLQIEEGRLSAHWGKKWDFTHPQTGRQYPLTDRDQNEFSL